MAFFDTFLSKSEQLVIHFKKIWLNVHSNANFLVLWMQSSWIYGFFFGIFTPKNGKINNLAQSPILTQISLFDLQTCYSRSHLSNTILTTSAIVGSWFTAQCPLDLAIVLTVSFMKKTKYSSRPFNYFDWGF